MNSSELLLDHEFFCTQCGNKGIPIVRKSSRCRAAGHLKELYCIHCGRVVNHAECIPYSDYDADTFREEFESCNFDKEGMRIMPLSEWRQSKKYCT